MSKHGREVQNQTMIFTPAENIVSGNLDEIRNEFKSLITEGINAIILDLLKVEMIDSSGIGVIVALHNSAEKVQKTIELRNVSENLFKLFKMMHLDRHFKISGRQNLVGEGQTFGVF